MPKPEVKPKTGFILKPRGSERTQLRIELTEFKGKQYVDIRRYYDAAGEWKPTPKGVAIAVEDFKRVYSCLRKMKLLLEEDAAQ